MKSMTVSGVYGKNTHARITWNGSANWTPVSLASDEVVGILQKRRRDGGRTPTGSTSSSRTCPRPGSRVTATRSGTAPDRSVLARARARHVDPYALIRKDL